MLCPLCTLTKKGAFFLVLHLRTYVPVGRGGGVANVESLPAAPPPLPLPPPPLCSGLSMKSCRGDSVDGEVWGGGKVDDRGPNTFFFPVPGVAPSRTETAEGVG